MNTEHNRATAIRFFELFSISDIDGALALMTDDVTWRIAGKKELLPIAGVYNKEKIARLFKRMLEGLTAGLHITVTSSTCEGNRVSLEAISRGDLKNGRVYSQEYHLLMEFRDGKIAAVREYLDTQHVHDVWIAEVSSQDRKPSPEPASPA